MILTKGIEIRALEAEFIRLGGEIDRTTPGHVQFKYQGLPTVGVHCNRVRAPRRLISMLRKMLAGTTVSPTRQPEPATQGASGVLEVEQPRAIQRPNPQRLVSMTAPHNPESVKEAAAELERRKAHDRAVALARALNRPEPAPYRPYVASETPVTWRDDVAYAPRIHDPISDADTQLRAFDDADAEGMVKWYPTAESWWEDMELWALPECRAPHGYRRYGIAIVRPAPYGLMPYYTYYNFRPALGCLIPGEERADQEACATVTVTPAMFARFKMGWDRGIDYTRSLVRAAGIADLSSTMKIPETPTIQVPEMLLGLLLIHLAHDRNHEDQNVAYVAIRLDNACRDLLRADYGRLKELGGTHLIDEARRNLGQI